MKKSTLVALVLAATPTMYATPTQACSLLPDSTFGTFTFANQRVPLNADLWIARVDDVVFASEGDVVGLIAPDGELVGATLVREGPDASLVPDTALVPGAWEVIVMPDAPEGEDQDRRFPFDVVDTEDTTAPAPAVVTIERVDIGGPLEAFFGGCGGYERRTIRKISIALDDVSDVARVIIDGETFTPENGEIWVANREEDGTDVVVTTVDFAGNESEPVTASGDGAGGCSSVPATSSSMIAALLLLSRRQGRRQSRDQTLASAT